MALTPIEVENTRFKGALGGYNRAEVDQFMQQVSRALEDQLHEIKQLRQQISQLEHEVDRNRESEELLKNSVMLAQKTCDELIAAAHKKAELIQGEALAEGDMLKRQFAELRSQREQFEYAFHGLLTGFINRLEQGNPALAEPAGHRAIAGPANAQARQQTVRAEPTREPQGFASVGRAVPPSSGMPAAPPNSPGMRDSAGPTTPAASGSPDRDSDIDDFSRAITDAESKPGAWPGDAALADSEVRQYRDEQEPDTMGVDDSAELSAEELADEFDE